VRGEFVEKSTCSDVICLTLHIFLIDLIRTSYACSVLSLHPIFKRQILPFISPPQKKHISQIGLALGEEADFEALNCLAALNLIRSTKLHFNH
jgi:hypothetical protein